MSIVGDSSQRINQQELIAEADAIEAGIQQYLATPRTRARNRTDDGDEVYHALFGH
ncbi:hypothetical protein [Rhodococcus rhodnii]|nr:hypothetical protein [Rhodococcus rhodnii]